MPGQEQIPGEIRKAIDKAVDRGKGRYDRQQDALLCERCDKTYHMTAKDVDPVAYTNGLCASCTIEVRIITGETRSVWLVNPSDEGND